MSTVIVYGDASDYRIQSSDATYSNAREALGIVSADVTTSTSVKSGQNTGFDVYQSFIAFTLPVGRPTSVALSLTPLSSKLAPRTTEVRAHAWSGSGTGNFVKGSLLSGKTLVASSSANQVTNTPLAFSMDAGAVGALVGGSLNTFVVASADQRTGTTPTGGDAIDWYSADQSGTSMDPTLTLVYTEPYVSGVGTVGTTTGGNLALPYPATVAGQRLVAIITGQDNVVSSSTGWTLKQGTNNGTGLRTEVWYMTAAADGTESGSVTFTRTSGNAAEGRILAVTGALASGDPIEAAAASANASSSTVTYPALTTLSNAALVVAVESLVGLGTLGAISGTDPTFVEESDDQFEGRPTFIDSATGAISTAGAALPITIPATAAVGDLAVVAITVKSATITATRSGWTTMQAAQGDAASPAARLFTLSHVITAGEPGTSINFTLSLSTAKAAGVMSIWRNASATPTFQSGGQVNASGTASVAPTLTPASANMVELYCTGPSLAVTLSTQPTGFTKPTNNSATATGGASSTQCGVGFAYNLYPTSGGATGTRSGTLSGTAPSAGVHILIAAANASAGPISQAIDDDNKTTAGLIASGRTATASVTGVNTGVLFAVKPGVTSTSYSHTGSGGATTGGAMVASRKLSSVASGGATTGGTASVQHSQHLVAAGGATAGGVATARFAKVFTVAGAGGLTSGGVATVLRKLTMVASGGLTSGGTAVARRALNLVASGGASTGGAATLTQRRAMVATGGLVSGGVAGARQARAFAIAGAGGLASSGTATITRGASYVATGGASTGGVATAVKSLRLVASGGLASSGSAASSQRHTLAATGGLASGGAALLSRRAALAATGGASASGTALVAFGHTIAGAGGLDSGGAAGSATGRIFVGSGGVITDGAATETRRLAWTASGGLVTGGAAVASVTGTVSYAHIGSGGLAAGGAASVSHGAQQTGSGGATTGGSASTAEQRNIAGSGGATTSGGATVQRRSAWTATGGLVTGGAATASITHAPQTFTHVGTGGLTTGGASPVRAGHAFFATGGVETGGEATTALQYRYTMVATGGLVTGGAALLLYQPIIPQEQEALAGSVAVSPLLSGQAHVEPELVGSLSAGVSLTAQPTTIVRLDGSLALGPRMVDSPVLGVRLTGRVRLYPL